MISALVFYSLFFLLLVAGPALVILVVLMFLHHERRFWRHARPVAGPLGALLARMPALSGLGRRFPRTVGFIERRFSPKDAWGLPATIALAVILVGLWLFIGVLHDVVAKDPLVTMDLRLHNAVPLFRTANMTSFMFWLTQFGGAIVMALVCSAGSVAAFARKLPRLAVTILLALASTGLLSTVLKVVIGHARPMDAIINANEASFPSGHMLSSAVVYGLIATLLLNSRARSSVRACSVTALLLLIVGIGLSRLYLGVHWPSDLLGSLALALMLLPALLFFLYYEGRIRWVDTLHIPIGRRTGSILAVTLLSVALLYPLQHQRHMVLNPVGPPAARHPIALASLRAAFPADLTRQSEDVAGGKMEPVSLLLVGSKQDLVDRFVGAGWTQAELPTPVRIVQEGLAVLRNQPDPNGPATPAFVGDKPQDFTFEKSADGAPTIRKRHHARLWQTRYCVDTDCRPLWLATASYDIGIELTPKLHLPTHRIDPAIDAERALVVSDLSRVGAVVQGNVPVIAALHGRNAAGDQIETDGNAVLVVLP